MTVPRQAEEPFNEFSARRYMLLTTFRKDGTPVPTPVGAYVVGNRLYFLTDPRSGKAKRLRRNPHVTISPCTMRGAPVGHTRHARARPVCMDEVDALAQAFAADHPVAFRLGRLIYHRRGKAMTFYELLPTTATRPEAA